MVAVLLVLLAAIILPIGAESWFHTATPKPEVILTVPPDPSTAPEAPGNRDPLTYLCDTLKPRATTTVPQYAERLGPFDIDNMEILPGQSVNDVIDSFTVVMLTYKRDEKLATTLKELGKIPFVHKVIVYWNDVTRPMNYTWPRIHVPIVFLNASKNSLNNRFLPSELIDTDGVLSLDDDNPATWKDTIFAFATWREHREAVVGLNARWGYVSSEKAGQYQGQYFSFPYDVSQYNLVLTSAAFLHRSYLDTYTNDMPEAIRKIVDEDMNCEDLAMNFLVATISRKPPVKTMGFKELGYATTAGPSTSSASPARSTGPPKHCDDGCLSARPGHYEDRKRCIVAFSRIYGYDPLLVSSHEAVPPCL